MKTAVVFIGLCVAFNGHAFAQTNQPVSKATIPPGKPSVETRPDELITKSGTIYRKFHVEGHDARGLTISYSPEGGGVGMAKVRFEDLPGELQRRYGYDPQKASEAEESQKSQQQQLGQLFEQMRAEEKAAKEQRAKDEALAEAAERQAKIEAEKAANEETKIKAAEKAAENAAEVGTNEGRGKRGKGRTR